MGSTVLSGPYLLVTGGINHAVTRKSPGIYCLGKTDTRIRKFIIYYTGRADDDLAKRLKDHVRKWYPQFKFAYASSPQSAFQWECELCHDFGILGGGGVHPARPADSGWKCPRCDVFD
jgi:hypothetical protein